MLVRYDHELHGPLLLSEAPFSNLDDNRPMANRFPQEKAEELLAKCHRRCCICHRFCGVKMELDHMHPVAEGGVSEIENAIPVCFECHAEIHAYNDKHRRGRKFQPSELRRH